jgi:hypothetical protein
MVMQHAVKVATRVGKFVDTKHVDNVIRNYKQERWVHNTERIGKEDSLSAWWSIEEMEDFIAQAKIYGADGLKFYFGAYDKEYKEMPEYAGRQTLVMVGTKETTTGKGIKNKDIYIQSENGTNILAYNRTRICPPNCGPGNEGLDDDTLGVTIVDRGDKGMMIL